MAGLAGALAGTLKMAINLEVAPLVKVMAEAIGVIQILVFMVAVAAVVPVVAVEMAMLTLTMERVAMEETALHG